MNWNRFNTYGDSYQEAFETLCTQLFERHLRRTYGPRLVKFRVINGAGGDGGIEAYGELDSGDQIAVQAKWFRQRIDDGEIKQIRKSVETGLTLRKRIIEYIICVPRALNSVKFGRGKAGQPKKPITDTEEKTIDDFTNEMETAFTTTNITWWFEQDIELQLQEPDNEGLHKFWFDRELITFKYLAQQFELQKAAWLQKRYIPELHGQGMIQREVGQLLFDQAFRNGLQERLRHIFHVFETPAHLAERFADTLHPHDPIADTLTGLATTIQANLVQVGELENAIREGNVPFTSLTLAPLAISPDLLDNLEDIQPTNLQLELKDRLIKNLQEIMHQDLHAQVNDILEQTKQIGRLFLGNPGTGKTHALTNTVDTHLNVHQSPAMIIRAKGTPVGDWSQILKKALELDGWNKNEVLSALETLAIRSDHREAKKVAAGAAPQRELTKVVLCIDGLEEDIFHWTEWYERLRESIPLMNAYPRVRFVFTARKYFLKEDELPQHAGFRVTTIPLEGDVPVAKVMDRYFSPEHYNIQVQPRSLVRGIDSLLALRLFCQLYEGQVLTRETELITAERELLRAKVNQIEEDFKRIKNSGTARKPFQEALVIVSDLFYNAAEIEHDAIINALQAGPGKYLTTEDLDILVDYLVNNGFLTKEEVAAGSDLLAGTKVTYTLTYQSIMEMVMADKFVGAIRGKGAKALPGVLLKKADTTSPALQETGQLVNERIVQNIVNQLFNEGEPLIGDGGYLAEGLPPEALNRLRLRALIQAPAAVAERYRGNIDALYLQDHRTRYDVFANLIYPSAVSSANYFGAEYLHNLLMTQPSAFDRERLWLGWDQYDIGSVERSQVTEFSPYDLRQVLDPYGAEELYLSEFALHNETPLIYAWALSTLDQSLRERLRIALTKWALLQPGEFCLLLEKIFPCNDPQIQEDLASITLGLATKLHEEEPIGRLATWALQTVFRTPESHRNVIVREGFRAIVEKALSLNLIDEAEAVQARPVHYAPLVLLPLDQSALENGQEEIYPIVHDLAWYVIKRSFHDFLEQGSVELTQNDQDDEDNDSDEDAGTGFLRAYLRDTGKQSMSAHQWAMAAAIAYMQSLGFSRTDGNGYTDASHGSKSRNFTLEEKYTWLAVHYLKGYLSDYLPLKESGTYVTDYLEIVDVPNPAEFIGTTKLDIKVIEDNWLLREPLAPELTTEGEPDDRIELAMDAEPVIDFARWIQFKGSDFLQSDEEKEWLALFNYTSVHDSQQYIKASIDLRGLLIEKGQAPVLLKLLKNHPSRTHFVESIDRLVGSPQTDTYSNPSDIVWMHWIGESYSEETYYTLDGKEKQMHYTVTSVTKNTVEGETEIYIPSKKVRTLLSISELDGQLLLDSSAVIKGYLHIQERSNYDRQEMVLVDKSELLQKLEEQELEIIWLADLYRSKNPLNEAIKSERHPMKTRKYFVYFDAERLVAEKFWDARFSNRRDE